MTKRPPKDSYFSQTAQLWAEHWLVRLRQLPRVVTESEIDSLKLLIFGAGQSWGIADGAARIRYLVGSKLINDLSINAQGDEHLEKALAQVIADGELAAEELAKLSPGLLIGVEGQRAPSQADLRRMGLEYKSGFAISHLTLQFCELHSIRDGADLLAAIDDLAARDVYLETIRVLAAGSHKSKEL
jgi:hypothetical protein